MRISKKCLLGISLGILLAAILIPVSIPKVRTTLFVALYHEDIEQSLIHGMGVPADDAVLFGYRHVNTWEGEHTMTEFLISASGFGSETSYYGCYYSPDDVPMAFQNLQTELITTQDGWIWQGEGDNAGFTSKIMDHWYYFEASF